MSNKRHTLPKKVALPAKVDSVRRAMRPIKHAHDSKPYSAAPPVKAKRVKLDSSAPEIIIDAASEAEREAQAAKATQKRAALRIWPRSGGNSPRPSPEPPINEAEAEHMRLRVEDAINSARERIESDISATEPPPGVASVPLTKSSGRAKRRGDKWQRSDNAFNEVSRAIHARASGTLRDIKFSMSTRISWNYARIMLESLVISLVIIAAVYVFMVMPRMNEISDMITRELTSVSQNTEGGMAALSEQAAQPPKPTAPPTPVSSLPPDERSTGLSSQGRPKVALFEMNLNLLDATYVRFMDIDGNVLYDDAPFDMTCSSLLGYFDGTFYLVDSFVVGLEGRVYQVYVGVSLTYWLRLLMVMLLCVAAIDLMRGLYFILQGKRINAQMLGPILEMSETARHLNAQNMSERINVEGTKSELRELALVINEMLDRIESGYDGQKQFVSDASHELRTPISVIQGYANMLTRWGKDDAEVREEAITAIAQEAANMKELVEKLLFLARNDKKTLKLKPELFDISEIVEDSVRETSMIVTDREIEQGAIQSARVLGDKQTLKQALRIFIDNACKYTPPGGTITISCEQGGMGVMISVADTGCGIPADGLKKVFDRFYRVDDSRGTVPGHGLGLSIARIIALNHGGKIHVRSKEGVGSIFTLELPGIK